MSAIVHNYINRYEIDQKELKGKLQKLYPQATEDKDVVNKLKAAEPVPYCLYLKEYESKNSSRSYELILADFSKACLAADKIHQAFAYLTDAIRQHARDNFVPGIPEPMKENLEVSAILGELVTTTNLCNIFWTCYTCNKKKSKL
jgi:hypothetical protein